MLPSFFFLSTKYQHENLNVKFIQIYRIIFLQLGLFSLALQGDTCIENSIDLMHIVAVANNKTDEEVITKYNEGVMPALNFTDEQLKVIEADLINHHSPEKAPHTMTILRGFQNRGSPRELESFEVSDQTSNRI